MAQFRRPCILCGSENEPAPEDVIPVWAKRHMKRLRDRPNEPGIPAVKVAMCRPCNNALGDRLETPASVVLKPMLASEELVLTPRQQTLVAAWIAKVDLEHMLGRADEPTRAHPFWPTLEKETREGLLLVRDSVRPPNNLVIRIGVLGHRTDPARLEDLFPPGWPRPVAQNATFQFGALFWETVIGGRVAPNEVVDVGDFAAAAQSLTRLHTLWPPDLAGLRYPPSELLHADDPALVEAAWESTAAWGRHR